MNSNLYLKRRVYMAKVEDEQPQALTQAPCCPPWLVDAHKHVMGRSCLNPNTIGLLSACGKCSSCAQLSAGSSGEFRYLQPAGKSHTIRIDPVRELVDWLQFSASAGRYRIALIVGADTMNRAAANALLKTLEEPAANSVCLLVSDKPAQLPATLISRCQRLPLAAENPDVAIEWLSSQLPVGVDAFAAFHEARGAPIRAIRMTHGGT